MAKSPTRAEQQILEKRIERLEENFSTIIKKLDGLKVPNEKSKPTEEIIYDRLEEDLKKDFFGKIVAIDLDQEKMVGYGDTVREAHKLALKNSNETQFYFRKVGFSGIETLC